MAFLRTVLNGWCTLRRFQSVGKCAFGCTLGKDELEHYLVCRKVWDFGYRWLALVMPLTQAEAVSQLVGVSLLSDEQNMKLALLVAAAYRAHNIWRHSGRQDGAAFAFLPQALREAVREHGGAMRAVDVAWASERAYEE